MRYKKKVKWVHSDDLQSAGKRSAEVCLVLGEEPGQAKVADLGLELVVQEDVAGLDVAVNDPQV